MNMSPNSGNRLLVFGCECNVSDTHRNSAAEGGQLPGLPEERMPPAWFSSRPCTWRPHCRAAGLGRRCPMQAAGPDPWPGGCECGGGDTMNALAANDIEARTITGKL